MFFFREREEIPSNIIPSSPWHFLVKLNYAVTGMLNDSYSFGTKHKGYFEHWVAGSNKTQDVLKCLIGSAKRTAQIYYLCYNQAFIRTIHQTDLLEVNLRK